MVEIADINDRKSLKAWLEETGQPREACIALAHRAAMRVMPVVVNHFARTGRHSSFPVLRALLVSGVASGAPPALLTEAGHRRVRTAAAASRAAAAYARAAYDAGAASRAAAAYAGAYAADAAAAAYDADAAAAYTGAYATYDAYAADAAAAAAYARAAYAWAALRSDCQTLADNGNLFERSLWPDSPDWAGKTWSRARTWMEQEGWQFWIGWYERALAGEPQPWPLLLEIALQEDAFWKGSDDEVMARINAIVERYEASARQDADDAVEIAKPVSAPNRAELASAKGNAPNAEEIFLNGEVFDVRPLTDIPPDPLAASRQVAMGLVSDMQTAAKGSNAYGELAVVADDIETEVVRSEVWPMMIYDALTEAVAGIDYLVRAGELPENDWRVERFKRRLSKAAHDIYLWDSFVRQAVDKRNEKHFDSLTEDDRRNILTLIRALISESSTLLADQLKRDAETIAGAVSFAAASVKNAIYRVYSRLVAMAHLDWDRVDKLSKLAGIGSFVLAVIALFVASS